MKKKSTYIHIIYFLFGVLCFQACYDDKGNYDYQEINEIKISGLETKKPYTIRVGDPITIKPIIESTLPGDEEDYTYEWIWVNAYYKGKTYNLYSWSNLKEWDNFQIGLPAGNYTFYYRVKDKKTGATWFSDNISISILNDISKGFVVLSDIDNTGRIDFVNSYKDTFDLRLDILKSIGTELPTLKNPLEIYCTADENSPYFGAKTAGDNFYMVSVLTGNGTYRLHPSDFRYEETYNITGNFLLEGLLPSNFYAKKIHYHRYAGTYLLMDNNNNIYCAYPTFRIFWTAGIYINLTSAEERKNISPIFVPSKTGAIMYDLDSHSFFKQTSADASTSAYLPITNEKEFINGTDTLLFKYNNTGKELIYMHNRDAQPGTAGNPNLIYIIQKDLETKEYYFGCFTHTGVQQFYRKLRNLPELSEAKEFAMTNNLTNLNYANEFMYYRTDNKIYAYDILNDVAQVVYPLASDQGNNLITHFNFIFVVGGTWADYLAVATYDPAKPVDSCGKLQIMKVTPVYGTLSVAENKGEKMEWTGFGKIKSVAWKDK